jgi:hypothetical protein
MIQDLINKAEEINAIEARTFELLEQKANLLEQAFISIEKHITDKEFNCEYWGTRAWRILNSFAYEASNNRQFENVGYKLFIKVFTIAYPIALKVVHDPRTLVSIYEAKLFGSTDEMEKERLSSIIDWTKAQIVNVTVIKIISEFHAFSDGNNGLMDHGAKNINEVFNFETMNFTRWIEFDCPSCNHTLKVGMMMGGYKSGELAASYNSLSWIYGYKLGELNYWLAYLTFKIKETRSKDRYYAFIENPYHSTIHLLLKKCPHCTKEYMVFYAPDGKTMWDSQDISIILAILQVEMDDEYRQEHFVHPPRA